MNKDGTKPTPEQVEQAVGEAAAQDKVTYDLERKARAENLGIRVATLDEIVAERREEEKVEAIAPFLAPDEPWDQPVDGHELLLDIYGTIRKQVYLSKQRAMTCALWVLFAHTHDAWQISPQLLITSPEPECGKTVRLDTLAALSPKSLTLVSITPATLFRLADRFHPSMFLDEDDCQNKELLDQLRAAMNGGHRKNSAMVPRVEGDKTREVKLFSLWAPKAIARIGSEGVHATQIGRSIQVAMRRMTRSEKENISKLPKDPRKEFEVLRRRCTRWAADNFDTLAKATPELPTELADRAQDNWEPLLAIADLCGQGELARDCAITLSGMNRRDTTGEMLLSDLRDLFDEEDVEHLPTTYIVRRLKEREDRPWAHFYGRSPISEQTIAKIMKGYYVGPKRLTLDRDEYQYYVGQFLTFDEQQKERGKDKFRPMGYHREHFAKPNGPWERYLPPKAAKQARPTRLPRKLKASRVENQTRLRPDSSRV